MRLPARRTATSALCATFLLGLAGPVASAAEARPAREHARTTPWAPLPDAETLRARTGDIGLLGGTLTPVADLLNAVLAADGGRLSRAEADQHADAVEEALARAEAARTTTPGADSPAGTAQEGADPVTLPADSATDARTPRADLTTQALEELRPRVDALVTAVTKSGTEQIGLAADGVVTGVVNIVTATLADGRLPAADLAGLPALSQILGQAQPGVSRSATGSPLSRP